MAVNMKLGVDLGSFNSGINQAKAQIKTFDAALKSAESQFKATGDAESAMTTKMSALSSKLSTQKKIVDDYRRALETMTKNNVDPLSTAFQKMQKEMLLAESAMYDTQVALNELNNSEQQAATSADQLTKSVNGIGKKISLDQVISGINKITDGLENAAKKAVDFGATLFREIMQQAGEADDIMTKSMMYDMTPERYQAITKLAATWAETSVESIMKARQRVQNKIGDITDVLMGIGVDPYKNKKRILGTDQYTGELKDWEDIFWEAGDALLHLDDAYEKTQKAEEIFGRKWEELVPMFKMGRDEYEKTLNAEEVNAAETIEKLAKLNDTVNALKLDFGTLEKEVLAGMAPALTAGAEALNGVLSSLLEYLQKPEGQKMLEDMETAVSGLFEDLGKIDPAEVVKGFTEVFTKITDGVKWLVENRQGVVDALKYIVEGWALLKLTGGALDILKLINGINTLNLFGTNGNPVTTGINGTQTTKQNAGAAVAAGTGAMIFIDYNPLQSLEYQKQYGRSGWAKYMDDMMGTNLFEMIENRKNNGPISGGGGGGGHSFAEEEIPVEVVPVAPDKSAENIAEQIGAVTVPVNLSVVGTGMGAISGGGGHGIDPLRQAIFGRFSGYANGIPYVPDTRLAWLHHGERVLTAAQNRNYTANSNLYVEHMHMGGRMDAQALAAELNAQNRRISAGFGQ